MVSFWSVLSATLWFVLALLLLYALRDRTGFLMRHGVAVWSMAVVLTIVRLLLPLDSEHMLVLRSYRFLPMLRRGLDHPLAAGLTVSSFLKAVWLVGTLCGVGVVVFDIVRDSLRRYTLRRLQKSSLPPDVCDAAQQCGIDTDMIFIAPYVDGPEVRGFIHPLILLPDAPYEVTDWVHILLHEKAHMDGQDAWLKAGFLVFRCIFWWNPLVHLAQKPVNEILELRCDKTVLTDMTPAERIAYVETLCHVGRHVQKRRSSLAGANFFASPTRADTLHLRAKTALDAPVRWDKTAVVSFVLSLLLFAASYAVILQPAGLPPSEDVVPVSVVTTGTTYLKKLPSGDYELWCDGEFVWIVSADELNDELYQDLEVLP